MKFCHQAPPFLFFTGKGGVGKTSLACATAIHFSQLGRRVLLISTDPASNIAQVFGQTIGSQPKPIDAIAGLSALEINPQEAAARYRQRIVDPVRGVLPDAVVASIEEQLSGACTTEIAAFDEFTHILTDQTLISQFDHIIFDTAPTGHTIRMLQLPSAWRDFLTDHPQGASCLGPLAGLEKQQVQYQAAVDILSQHQQTRLVLVARAQTATLKEVARTCHELTALGITHQCLVINGVLPEHETKQDTLALAIYQREQLALQQMPDHLRQIPQDMIALKAMNMVGIDALKQLFDPQSVLAEQPAIATTELPHSVHSLNQLMDHLAEQTHGLIMVMGKGGVGKTTLAAAIAVALAQRNHAVHLSTSDPAAHLTDMVAGDLPHLTVSRIDPELETERYRQHILASAGQGLDEAGRAVLEEDLRSPCTEEIAVFQAFSKIINQAQQQFVVMDTAPTGHTLLLLDATGSYHREMARQTRASDAVQTPMTLLQNSEYTKVIIATVAETTPVLEAIELQKDLNRAGIKPWAWVVNQSLVGEALHSPLLMQRASQEQQLFTQIALQSHRIAQVPLMAAEPIGIHKLAQLTDINLNISLTRYTGK